MESSQGYENGAFALRMLTLYRHSQILTSSRGLGNWPALLRHVQTSRRKAEEHNQSVCQGPPPNMSNEDE